MVARSSLSRRRASIWCVLGRLRTGVSCKRLISSIASTCAIGGICSVVISGIAGEACEVGGVIAYVSGITKLSRAVTYSGAVFYTYTT